MNPDPNSSRSISYKIDDKQFKEFFERTIKSVVDVQKKVETMAKGFVDFAAKSTEGYKKIGVESAKVTKNVEALNTATEKGVKTANQGLKEVTSNLDLAKKAAFGLGAVAGTAFNVFGNLSDAASYLKIAQIGIQGLTKAAIEFTGIGDRMMMLFELMGSQGFSTLPVAQFTELNNAILGSDESTKNFITDAVSAFTEFQAALTQVNTILRANNEELEANGEAIQRLVNGPLKNAVSSVQALNGQYQVLSGGFSDAEESQTVLNSALQLSVVGYADAYDTAGLLVKTMRAYGFEAGRAAQTSAELNKIVELGITTVPELSATFGQTATVAKQAGVNIDELGAAVAVLTSSGRSTPTALTGIEALLRNIINKTPQAEDALSKLSQEAGRTLRLDVQSVREKGLASVLQDINDAAKGNATVLSDILPDSLAFSTALGLMAENGTRFSSAIEGMGTATTEEFGEVFDNVIQDKQKRFEAVVNRFQELLIEFGKNLAPVFDGALNVLEGVGKAFDMLSPEMKTMIAQFLTFKLAVDQGFNGLKALVGGLIGTAVELIKVRAGMIAMNVAMDSMSGKSNMLVATLKDLVKENVNYAAILKQLVGLDQSYLLSQKENITTAAKNNLSKVIDDLSNSFENLYQKSGSDITGEALEKLQNQSTKASEEIQKQLRKIGDPKLTAEIGNQFNKVAADIQVTYGEGVASQIDLVVEGQKKQAEVGTDLIKATEEQAKSKQKLRIIEQGRLLVAKAISVVAGEEAAASFLSATAAKAESVAKAQNNVVTATSAATSAANATAKSAEGVATGANVVATELETASVVKNNIVQTIRQTLSSVFARTKGVEATATIANTVATEAENAVLVKNNALQILRSNVLGSLSKAWAFLGTAIGKIGGVLTKALTAVKTFATGLLTMNPVILGVVAALTAVVAVTGSFLAFRGATKHMRDMSDEMETLAQNASATNEKLAQLATGFDVDAFNKVTIESGKLGETMRDLVRSGDVAQTILYGYQEAAKEAGNTSFDATKGVAGLAIAFGSAIDKIGESRVASEQLGKWVDTLMFFQGDNPFEKLVDFITTPFQIIGRVFSGLKAGFDSVIKYFVDNKFYGELLPQIEATESAIYDKLIPATADFRKGLAAIPELTDKINQGFDVTQEDLIQNAKAYEALTAPLQEQITLLQKGVEAEKDPERRAILGQRLKNLQEQADATDAAYQSSLKMIQVQNQLNRIYKINQAGAGDNFTNSLKFQVAEAEKAVDQIYAKLEEGTVQNMDEVTSALTTSINAISTATEQGAIDAEEAATRINDILAKRVTQNVEGVSVEVSPLSTQQQQELVAQRETLLQADSERDSRQRSITQKQYEAQFAERLLSEQEFADQSFEIEKQNADASIKLLDDLIAYRKSVGQSTVDLELQRSEEILGLRRRAAEREEDLLERQFRKELQLQENRVAAYKIGEQAKLNEIEMTTRQLEQEEKLIQSRESLARAQDDLAQNQLQNQLKFEGDITDRAAIETQLAQQRVESLGRQQAIERQSLVTQNRINESNLKREEIQARIAQAEVKLEIFKTQQELARAQRERKPEEELRAIELQIQQMSQQSVLMEEQVDFIQQQQVEQQEISANAEAELSIRQQISSANAQIELQLARQRELVAAIEEEAAQVANELARQQQELNVVLQEQDAISKALETQNKVLDARKSILDAQNNFAQTQFSIAQDLAKNDRERNKIAEAAAKQKVDALQRTQEIERQSLELQLAQNEAAQKRAEIENQIQQIKNQADIAQARAELARAEADPQASAEQIEAARIGVQAQIETGAGLSFAGQIIQQQTQFEQQSSGIQRNILSMNQQSARDQAELEYTNSIANPNRRRNARRDLRNRVIGGSFNGELNSLSGLNFNTPTLSLPEAPSFDRIREQFISRQGEFGLQPRAQSPTLNTNASSSQLASQSQQSRQGSQYQTASSNSGVVVQMTNEINIEIDGNSRNDGLRRRMSDDVQQGVLDGLYKVADRIEQLGVTR